MVYRVLLREPADGAYPGCPSCFFHFALTESCIEFPDADVAILQTVLPGYDWWRKPSMLHGNTWYKYNFAPPHVYTWKAARTGIIHIEAELTND